MKSRLGLDFWHAHHLMFNEETLPGFFYLVDPVPPTFSPPIPNQIVKKEKRKVSFFSLPRSDENWHSPILFRRWASSGSCTFRWIYFARLVLIDDRAAKGEVICFFFILLRVSELDLCIRRRRSVRREVNRITHTMRKESWRVGIQSR